MAQSDDQARRGIEELSRLRPYVAELEQRIAENKKIEEALRRSEARLREAAAMDTVKQLAEGVAHNFNNLLTVIEGYCDMLLRKFGSTDEIAQPIREIHKAATRAAKFTVKLLEFGRRRILYPRRINLNGFLSGLAEELYELLGEGIELSIVEGQHAGDVEVDPAGLREAIINLAANACEAMISGGRLEIATAPVDIGERDTQLREDLPPGSYVMLTVSDTGRGIEQAILEHIFEPFFTTRTDKASGLGLSTVRGFIMQSGGHIFVRSEVNKGTTFTIYLPSARGKGG